MVEQSYRRDLRIEGTRAEKCCQKRIADVNAAVSQNEARDATEDDPRQAVGHHEHHRLGEKKLSNESPGGAERPHCANLARTFDHGDHQSVDDDEHAK